ncbi:MAG: UDP-N-acetylmuramate dehydrogenase [Acidobacteria bacterium]|nr:UDP-N-acetylmuramate dehydrogenase [Acidobacteriota bacterium]
MLNSTAVNSSILENVPLAPLTTLGIGGPARYFIHTLSENTVLDAISFAKDNALPLFVLGGGSNLLVADRGFPGLVLKIGIRGFEWNSAGGRQLLCAGAGEEWDHVVAECVGRNLAGVECLSGIPGSVGGTPIQNIGAYGQEVSEVLTSVRAFDRQTGKILELSREDCGFTYRTSIFNTTARDRYIVLHVSYSLIRDAAATIRYPDVRRFFEGHTGQPSLQQVRQAVRSIRASKAMLLVEGDPDCRSAGSFFKNPIVSETEFAAIQSAIPTEPVPRYPARPGFIKTAAAWLIERSGFSKGYSLGPVGLSTKHTLALINKGGATADDMLRLVREIRTRVKDRFGVNLVPEPVFLGFGPEVIAEFFGRS